MPTVTRRQKAACRPPWGSPRPHDVFRYATSADNLVPVGLRDNKNAWCLSSLFCPWEHRRRKRILGVLGARSPRTFLKILFLESLKTRKIYKISTNIPNVQKKWRRETRFWMWITPKLVEWTQVMKLCKLQRWLQCGIVSCCVQGHGYDLLF